MSEVTKDYYLCFRRKTAPSLHHVQPQPIYSKVYSEHVYGLILKKGGVDRKNMLQSHNTDTDCQRVRDI